MLQIRLNVSEQLLKDQARWLKLRALLVGEEAELELLRKRKTGRRTARATSAQPPAPVPEEAAPEPPRLYSNLQKAAYALHRLHESSPNPSGYTARQISLFLKEQNIDALTAEQLSWTLATMVNRSHASGKPLAQRIRRGRYLPTEHTRELFA